jgi:hypothetical protein
MAPQKKDFIGFMLDAEKSKKLTSDFLDQRDATKLHEFFQKNGYTKISADDCKDLIKCMEGEGAKELIRNRPKGECIAGQKAY